MSKRGHLNGASTMTGDQNMGLRAWLAVAAVLASITCSAQNANVATDELAPDIDHHQHLLSPRAAAILNNPRNAVEIPAAVAQVLRQHEASWNDPVRLAGIYSADAAVLDDDDDVWVRGRDEVADSSASVSLGPIRSHRLPTLATSAALAWLRITQEARAPSGVTSAP
jgi:hypothetical protein